ncbi:MAG: GIY-YIG nuclease family protein, partial [Pseudomonadota bacterium]
MTNDFGNVMYVGVTNNLEKRVLEHQSGLIPGYTKKYNIKKLVYYEQAMFWLRCRRRQQRDQ